MRRLKPFWRYYGGKARASRYYPQPEHDTIVEPFAGAAGYACRYPDRDVILVDKSPIIAGIWRYLIGASEQEIMSIPDVPEGGTVDDLNVCQEARWLVGFWLNGGTVTPRKSPSSRCRKHSQDSTHWAGWGWRSRQRVAEQLSAIRHWRIIEGNYTDAPDTAATWFIDPPYNNTAGQEYQYQIAHHDRLEHRVKFGAPSLDHAYLSLGRWCRSRRGLVIVCENDGAGWLDFKPLRSTRGMVKRSREVIWLNRPPLYWQGVQTGLFGLGGED